MATGDVPQLISSAVAGGAPAIGAVSGHLPWEAAVTVWVMWIGNSYLQTYYSHIEAMAKLNVTPVEEPARRPWLHCRK